MQACPFCNEMIKQTATRCKFCCEFLKEPKILSRTNCYCWKRSEGITRLWVKNSGEMWGNNEWCYKETLPRYKPRVREIFRIGRMDLENASGPPPLHQVGFANASTCDEYLACCQLLTTVENYSERMKLYDQLEKLAEQSLLSTSQAGKYEVIPIECAKKRHRVQFTKGPLVSQKCWTPCLVKVSVGITYFIEPKKFVTPEISELRFMGLVYQRAVKPEPHVVLGSTVSAYQQYQWQVKFGSYSFIEDMCKKGLIVVTQVRIYVFVLQESEDFLLVEAVEQPHITGWIPSSEVLKDRDFVLQAYIDFNPKIGRYYSDKFGVSI